MREPIRVKEYISETGMKFLPNGMLIKSDTGMGATHLELICARHSIIVEPIRVTAANKVRSAMFDDNYLKDRLPFYVGSAVGEIPKPNDSNIREYLNDDNVVYKKFICVADSLPRVISNIIMDGQLNTGDFFLLIDEVDSIQMDSSFRRAMDSILDYYENQPFKMRAMLTATPLEFSNPMLQNEPITHFSLIESSEKPTFFIETPNGLQCIIDRVEKIIKSDNGKIVIVINHIQSICTLIEEFVKIGVISDHIAVLCSAVSKTDFPEHYRELTGKTYPRQINFVTSAYYSGYDIEENYHLICYTHYRVQSTWLSPAQIKQIYGRCRKPFRILSHMLVYRPQRPSDKWSPDYVTITGLIAEAQAVIDSEKCFNINYPKDAINNLGILKNFRALLVDALNAKKINSIRYNSDRSKLVVSYFFIDSIVEKYNTYQSFYRLDSMPIERLIESGFKVKQVRYYHETMLNPSKSEEIKGGKFKLVNKLEEIRHLPEEDIADELRKMEGAFSSIVNGRVLSFMNELKLFFPLKDVINEAIDSLKGKDGMPCRDLRSFNNWLVGKYFQTTDADTPIRIFVNHYFKIGDQLTSSEIATRMKDCIVHAQLKTLLGFESQKPVDIKTNKKKLVTMAAKFVSFYRHRKKGGDVFRVLFVIPSKSPRPESEIEMSSQEMFMDHVDISTTFR